MVEVNKCDLSCPKTAAEAARRRHNRTEQSESVSRLLADISLGLRAVAQVARTSAYCPSRSLVDDWQPAPKCIAAAQEIVNSTATPLRRSELTAHEQAVMTDVKFAEDPPSTS